MRSDVWWYLARSGGAVAWVLSAASVLAGLSLSAPVPGHRKRSRRGELHRVLGGVCLVFVALHALGLALDSSLDLGPAALFVPFAAKAHANAIAWGVIAFYLLVAVEVTSLLRDRISERVWRLTHYAGFLVFIFGTVHGLRIGTDTDRAIVWWPAAAVAAAVLGLCAYRLFAGDVMTAGAAEEERVPASLLERTLSGLERLDVNAYPRQAAAGDPVANSAQPAPSATAPAPAPAADAAPAPSSRFEPMPLPTRPVSPSPAEPPGAMPAAAPPLPTRPGPMFPDGPGRRSDRSVRPMFGDLPARHARHDPSMPPATPAPAPADGDRALLPTRTPRRMAATTAPAASLDAWRPATAAAGTGRAGGPPPPPQGALDPQTGEPDPQAYRRWLREWLEYVESQP